MPASSDRTPFPSRLPRALRRAVSVTAAALALTGAFLAGPAQARADEWTAALVLLHLGLGTLLALLGLGAGMKAVAGGRRPGARPHRRDRPAESGRFRAMAVGGWLLAAAFVTGAVLIGTAVRGETASRLVLEAHSAAGYAAILIAGAVLILRGATSAGNAPVEPPGQATRRSVQHPGAFPTPRACALIVVLLLGGLLAGSASKAPGIAPDPTYQPEEYYAHLTATNARQARNPLFPAGTLVTVEPGARLRSAAACGAAGCHPKEYRQWLGSPHQQAAADPLYCQSADRFEAERGRNARRWCQGCHAPAALPFGHSGVQGTSGPSDRTDPFEHEQDLNTQDRVPAQRVDFAAPGPGPGPAARVPPSRPPPPERLNAYPGNEGVNCLACHAAVRVMELSGNGRFELRVPSDYPFAASQDPRLRSLHDFLLRLRPGPHRLAFMRLETGTPGSSGGPSVFCAACHRMSYNLPQNDYKFMRTADEYGTWQAGPFSGQSIHDFDPPGPERQCQDCHDPHQGSVQAFRRPSGVHIASCVSDKGQPAFDSVGYGTRNPPHARMPERLKAPPITVDLFALRRLPRRAGLPEELIAPLDQERPALHPGETVTVDVVIRNRGSGHEFPAGAGYREAWLEFALRDGAGRLLLRSGGIGSQGQIDPGAHTYGLLGLDRHGQRLAQGDLWNMTTPLYYRSILPGQPDTDRRTIQPGESDVAHYHLRVPTGAVGPLQLQARLWIRTVEIRPAGTGDHGGSAPERRRPEVSTASRRLGETVLIAADAVTLPPEAGRGSDRMSQPAPVVSSAAHEPLRDRWYDYGVGLLLQGDLPRAQQVMRRVQAWVPRDPKGYFGLGRVYLTEGDLLAARAQFERARQLAPSDLRAQAFLAATERRMGEFDAALTLLQPLVRAYPRDRLLWFDIGMSHYLSGRYELASQAFLRMLDIDPDDLAAHYNLMRSLRSLRRVPEARREEVIYQSLREDDNARRIGLAYLRAHPLADRETRTVHEHPLTPERRDEARGKGMWHE